MKLEKRNNNSDEFRCDLTKELDKLSNISKGHYYDMYYHYILADDYCKKEKCLAIRVPGGTVGGIWINDNNEITKIEIDTNYVVKSYPNDINELIQKYIEEVIEW